MFQAQNRETIHRVLEKLLSHSIHYDDERDKTMFHNTTPDLQDQDQDHSMPDQDQDRFFVSDRSYPKTDGLRPHHWFCKNEFSSFCSTTKLTKTDESISK